MAAKTPMSETEIKSVLQAKLQNSLAYMGGRLSNERIKALRYYNGDPFGNEQEGRSAVVKRDVAEVVDAIMPSLMRVFMGGDELVRFQPQGPGEEDAADQATDYCNWIITQQPDSYTTFHDWFKDALIQRLGVVKVWWEADESWEREEYEGINDAELQALLTDEDVELRERTDYPPQPTPDGAMETGGQPGMLHDVVLRRKKVSGHICIRPVPPDEFLVDRRVVTLDEAGFTAHRQRVTKSDLYDMGFPRDKIERLPVDNQIDLTQERLERFKQEDEMPYRTSIPADPATGEVWLTECYIKMDFDRDGHAEMRKITVAGDASLEILRNEEVDDHPFCSVCPNPMPHKLFGQSVADKVMDLQLMGSTVMRAFFDNLYQSINKRMTVVEGQANLDDLLQSRPGGIIRVKGPAAVTPIDVAPVGPEALQAIDYLDSTREQRTGIKRMDTGVASDTLNPESATAARIQNNQLSQNIEYIARTFAETGVKRLFKRVLELICKYQQKPRVIRLRGQWVEMDPAAWNSRMEMTVNVGLGTGDKSEEAMGIQQLLMIDQQLIQMQGGPDGPLLTLPNVYAKLKKLTGALGLKGVEQYYTDPANAPPQPPKPDPKVLEAQAKAQMEAQKAQMQMQLDQQKMAMEFEMHRAQLDAEMGLKREQLAAELQLKREQFVAELALKREIGLATAANSNTNVNSSDVRMGGEPG